MTEATTDHASVLDDLASREQIHDCTDLEGLREHLAAPRRLYCGFDPTANSLTIGNLVPIMLLRRFQQAGHTPVVIVGGATGRIGDPSGKHAERSLMTDEEVEANIAGQRRIFERVLGSGVEIVDNYDWFRGMGFLDALREIGKHFSVNEMIRRDAVRNRLEREGQGLSYTEFSYMLLQAYDFLHLFGEHGVTIQCAGADQWGNIVSGVNLIGDVKFSDHLDLMVKQAISQLVEELNSYASENGASTDETRFRLWDEYLEREKPSVMEQEDVGLRDLRMYHRHTQSFGLVAPLLTKSDGGKFGKTETGAIWLTADRTSPYAFYQFWLNTDDGDLPKYLAIFTDLDAKEREQLLAEHAEAPHKRLAQKHLAAFVTQLIHGEEGLARAEAATDALFSGDVQGLDARTLNEAFSGVPISEHSKDALEGMTLVDLLPETSLASSKREAREFLGNGAVSVNGEKAGAERALMSSDLLHGTTILLRRGKKKWHVTRWA